MRASVNTEMPQVDVTCEEGDEVQVVLDPRPNGSVIYVHVQGITVLRVYRVEDLHLYGLRRDT